MAGQSTVHLDEPWTPTEPGGSRRMPQWLHRRSDGDGLDAVRIPALDRFGNDSLPTGTRDQ